MIQNDEGVWLLGKEEMKEKIKITLFNVDPNEQRQQFPIMGAFLKLKDEDLHELQKPFTNEEVKFAVFNMAIKIDLEKTYDKISWNFLKDTIYKRC